MPVGHAERDNRSVCLLIRERLPYRANIAQIIKSDVGL